nr:hypothetical protein [Tanacetum cinerariifolium]
AATFHCAVRIVKISTKRGWNYPSCGGEKCRKGNLDRKQDRFWCDSCHSYVDYPVLRYKLELEVEVSDDTAQPVVVMFDETARTVVKCLDAEETGLPPVLANIMGTLYTLKLKSNSYYEYANYESFTCWSVFLEEALDESGNSGTLAATGNPNTGVFVPLTTTPSVTTPSNPEESFVVDSKRKRSDVGCSSEAGKRKRQYGSAIKEAGRVPTTTKFNVIKFSGNNHGDKPCLSNILHPAVAIHLNTFIRRDGNVQSVCCLKLTDICIADIGLAASSMAKKRATNLKGKAIVDAPNVAPPETGCKSRGATSISKRITANLKGKAIADPNNVETTKTGWTTTCNVLFKKQTSSLTHREKIQKHEETSRLSLIRVEVSYHSLGAPSYLCPNYNATMWYEERNNKGNKDQDLTLSLCCQQGKVLLPRFKDTPEPLNGLLNYNQPATSAFRDLIRVYNAMFCFTSFEAMIDHSINKGMGLYIFCINGQNYHKIGYLLPTEGTQPRYAQLWFFDTHNKIRNRLGAVMDTDSEEGVDGTIVGSLIRMLDANSAIAKSFQMAKDWCHADVIANVELRLLSERTGSKQYNAPTVAEVAALITNDFGDGEPTRDIVVCKKDSPPKRISELHPSYMALQYPLLFPYGDDGYHEKIPYHINKRKRKTTRDYVIMKEYYTYVIQYRNDQTAPRTYFAMAREYYRYKVATNIDDIILAKLPSPTVDPVGYKAVSDYMLHGPCGKDNGAETCNVERKCSKHFPKPFYAETVIDQDGYPIYKRRDDKENVQQGQGMTEQKVTVVDEIKNYLNYRYLAPCKAVWRIFSFDIHHSYPSVMKLNFHLQNQQPVTLHDTDCLPALLQKEGIDNYCLMEIQDLLNTNGTTLTEFSDMPQPNPTLLTSMDNRLIREARAFDMNKSRIQHQQLYPQLNLKQRLIYEEVVDSVHNKKGQFHFVYRPGGIGKTFLYKTIISRLRSELKIVLAVASSGIFSLLLPGGRTAHSRFVIPLELLENNTCKIKQNTHLAKLMQQVELIIWDEAPMTQKYAFEALDKTLRDILGYPVPDKRNKIFGGMTVLLGGDFRQILLVSTLKQSMKVNEYNSNGDIDTRKQAFNQWVLAVGDGKVPARIKDGEDEPTWIKIPETFLIPSPESPIQ